MAIWSAKGTVLLHLDGKARAILTGERTALNFLGRLSGIATTVHRFAEKIQGTRARIRDTRKTTPGLRLLEKYAVKTGGGTNHRIGLYDAILLKENHIALAGGVKQALDQAHSYSALHSKPDALSAYEEAVPSRATDTVLPIQIEVRDERELREALSAGAESVLLDNMSPPQARQSVRTRPQLAAGVRGRNFRRHHARKCPSLRGNRRRFPVVRHADTFRSRSESQPACGLHRR